MMRKLKANLSVGAKLIVGANQPVEVKLIFVYNFIFKKLGELGLK
jgi:hypothetical protein